MKKDRPGTSEYFWIDREKYCYQCANTSEYFWIDREKYCYQCANFERVDADYGKCILHDSMQDILDDSCEDYERRDN